MSKDIKIRIFCKWCGSQLLPSYTGPCTKCGKIGKKGFVKLEESISFKGSLNLESRRMFFEENPKVKILIVVITYGSPLLGFFIDGFFGAAIGLCFGVISYWLSPFAVIKVKEIQRKSVK